MHERVHYSVDFWHTLGEPNPAYPAHRNRILAEAYGCTPEAAALLYKHAKNQWEQDAVRTGLVPPLTDLNHLFCNALGASLRDSEFENVVTPRLQEQFLANPPAVCLRALEALRQLRHTGATVSVGSNTNFIIRGAAIRQLLPRVGLFDFQLYSDELGVCKPSSAFFAHVLLQAGTVHVGLRQPRQVVQVGDSQQCDVAGAEAVGMRAVLVGGAYTTAQVLERMLRRRQEELGVYDNVAV